ncbi:MAG: glycosyltransferase family 2 protein [Candidatus Electrothrix sp. GW3-4]|uniref:glycosyltransferase family 2 protein n=1 Tax=Candidatus Electrothrix sp. GW3-4 TaxID=3126740 RepID=UPI0030D32A40
MKIGIITVLYKSSSVIEGFINSMNAQTWSEFDILFIENEVDEQYCETYIRNNSNFPFMFFRNEKNEGVARGNNQGIEHYIAQDDITHILFLNNDIIVDSNFLEKQVEIMQTHPNVEALAPKIFYHGRGEKIWYAGGRLSYFKGGPVHFGHNKRDKLLGRELFRINYAPTCSLIIRKGIFQRTGIRMWEQLFVYQDDYVFCKELHKAKVRLYYIPSIHLQHKISISTGGHKSEFSRYYLARNWAYTLRKFRNIFVLILPFIMILNALRGSHIENRAIIDSVKMP